MIGMLFFVLQIRKRLNILYLFEFKKLLNKHKRLLVDKV